VGVNINDPAGGCLAILLFYFILLLGNRVKSILGIVYIYVLAASFMETALKYKVFISHSSTDTWVVKQIQSKIGGLDTDTFLDEGCIDIGDDFENVILKELRKSNELLVLLTPWAQHRPYVWMEIGAAWGLGIRIVGVLHGLTYEDLNKDGSNPALLKKTNLIMLNDIDKYFSQLKLRVEVYEK